MDREGEEEAEVVEWGWRSGLLGEEGSWYTREDSKK